MKTSKTVLTNIFKDRTTKTKYGVIIDKISSLRYKVEDKFERVSIVNSTQEWGLDTNVIIQNDYIIGTGTPPDNYELIYV